MAKRLHLINYDGRLPVEIGGYGFFSHRDFDDSVGEKVLKSDPKHLVEIPVGCASLSEAGLGPDGLPLPVEPTPEIPSDESSDVPVEPVEETPEKPKKSKKKE